MKYATAYSVVVSSTQMSRLPFSGSTLATAACRSSDASDICNMTPGSVAVPSWRPDRSNQVSRDINCDWPSAYIRIPLDDAETLA